MAVYVCLKLGCKMRDDHPNRGDRITLPHPITDEIEKGNVWREQLRLEESDATDLYSRVLLQ